MPRTARQFVFKWSNDEWHVGNVVISASIELTFNCETAPNGEVEKCEFAGAELLDETGNSRDGPASDWLFDAMAEWVSVNKGTIDEAIFPEDDEADDRGDFQAHQRMEK